MSKIFRIALISVSYVKDTEFWADLKEIAMDKQHVIFSKSDRDMFDRLYRDRMREWQWWVARKIT